MGLAKAGINSGVVLVSSGRVVLIAEFNCICRCEIYPPMLLSSNGDIVFALSIRAT